MLTNIKHKDITIIILVVAVLFLIFFQNCKKTCGHIHNGPDSISLWMKNPITADLVQWHNAPGVGDALAKFGELHDILVMGFFAHLNDGICCVEHAVKAHNDGLIEKCEKDAVMSMMLLDKCTDEYAMFLHHRLGVQDAEKDPRYILLSQILEDLLETIECDWENPSNPLATPPMM